MELKGELARLQMRNYLHDDLHKWTWWLSLGAAVIPLVVWWKVVDRRRILEISR